MRDPYPLYVHALTSNSARARVRHLLYLLRAERLCEDRWRLAGDAIICGSLDDLARSVDCAKQLEEYAFTI